MDLHLDHALFEKPLCTLLEKVTKHLRLGLTLFKQNFSEITVLSTEIVFLDISICLTYLRVF